LSLLQRYLEYVQTNHLFGKDDFLLVAVSGGIDSVTLCHLCREAGFRFAIAHCNFQLRGAESERDQGFVERLATQLNVPLFIEKFDTASFAEKNKVSIQEAARDLRYSWFYKILEGDAKPDARFGAVEKNPNMLATAHNLDDNAETVLMNFCKGTGIRGLKGMQPGQGKLVRPLLFAKRQHISEYALENNINWVEDSSNSEEKYTRNYFRHQVIPVIEKMYPQLKQQLTDNITRFREAAELFEQAIIFNKNKLVEIKGEEFHIPILKLLKSTPLRTIIYEITKGFGFTHGQADEIVKLCSARNGSYILSSTHRIIRNRKWLIITSLSSKSPERFIIENANDTVETKNFSFSIKDAAKAEVKFDSEAIAFIDAGEIEFPLILRKWKTGDYFYPLGMRKKKKLARFFIDRKFSKIQKENAWIVESDKKIVWLVGHRIDDRFKLKPSTKNILSFKMTTLYGEGKVEHHR
jgi:tRNA(Ile)-lysidine synthase